MKSVFTEIASASDGISILGRAIAVLSGLNQNNYFNIQTFKDDILLFFIKNKRSHMVWAPRVTVAAVIEKNDRFLIVEEVADNKIVFNQPAGHLEPNESLIDAIKREVLEETAHFFIPTAVVGIYRWVNPDNLITFLRIAFTGTIAGCDTDRSIDSDILNIHWLNLNEINLRKSQLRSPLVLACINDYLQGQRYPLTITSDF